MRILLWHVHGAWTTSFVQGAHDYLVPMTPERDPDGVGAPPSWGWPRRVREIPVDRLADEPFDVAVLQRPHEIDLVKRWTGRTVGTQVPAVYVEHDTPRGDVPMTIHWVGNRSDIPIVHVAYANAMLWDNGIAPVRVIEQGIPDPGERWTGEMERAAVVINEPVRRGRITGTDLLAGFSRAAPLDVFGMGLTGLHERYACDRERVALHPDLVQSRMHDAIVHRRVYLHPFRWTSVGLSLIEAMQLGMPVVVLAMTEALRAVPDGAGCVSADPSELHDAIRHFCSDPASARRAGAAARAGALRRYGLPRFLREWDELLDAVR